jgi:small subunit ribosomal protein S1
LGEYGVGDKVSGRVEQITNFGVFVNFAPGVDGLIHISELDKEYTSHPETVTSVGSQIEAKIVEIDTEKKRIRLSIRQLREREDKEEKADYFAPKEDEVVIGDFVEEKIKEKLKGNLGK